MKRNKLVKVLGIALLGVTALSTISPVAANAAWKKNNTGWWYTEGSSWSVGWRKIDGVWYYFDKSGYMKTGWLKDNGTWYYLQSSGAMKTGWLKDNGTWYYLEKSGAMKTGWLVENGVYYLKESGAMAKGFTTINNNKYYFNEDGRVARGKTNAEGSCYYFNTRNGIAVANFNSKFLTTDGDGKITKLDSAGVNKYIQENDSKFLETFEATESNVKNYFMEPDIYSISDYLDDGTSYNIPDEHCLVVYYMGNNNNHESVNCIYLVGLESGKIYRKSEKRGQDIYEIKNNEKVNKYSEDLSFSIHD